jgi:hypothetical protein
LPAQIKISVKFVSFEGAKLVSNNTEKYIAEELAGNN